MHSQSELEVQSENPEIYTVRPAAQILIQGCKFIWTVAMQPNKWSVQSLEI